MQPGHVTWITGLSGSGKTTIAEQLAQALRDRKQQVILLDGDTLREVFPVDLGHDATSRLQAGLSYGRLCRMLSQQGIDVICSTISMFHEVRAWNRSHIQRYKEVYIRVPIEELIKRDSKQIYSRAKRGELTHVVGINAAYEEPQHPELIIDNHGDATPQQAVERILQVLAHD